MCQHRGDPQVGAFSSCGFSFKATQHGYYGTPPNEKQAASKYLKRQPPKPRTPRACGVRGGPSHLDAQLASCDLEPSQEACVCGGGAGAGGHGRGKGGVGRKELGLAVWQLGWNQEELTWSLKKQQLRLLVFLVRRRGCQPFWM